MTLPLGLIPSAPCTVQCKQCDQIERFFALWATIQSRWQQLFYPNCPHCLAIFVKLSKSFIFLLKSFLGNLYRYLAIFIWSHWLQIPSDYGRRWCYCCCAFVHLLFMVCPSGIIHGLTLCRVHSIGPYLDKNWNGYNGTR